MRKQSLFGAAFVLIGLAGLLYTRQHLIFESTRVTLPADGGQHEALRIRLPWPTLGEVTTGEPALLERQGRSLQVLLQSPVNPGQSQLHIRWRYHTKTIPVTFLFDPADSYGDGTPDFLRLHSAQDREAFRTWFVLLAESQLDRPNLSPEIKDCAALLRFCYREALHAHDEAWLTSRALQSTAGSIRQYTYPQTPLGANLFRVIPGPFLPADLTNGAFAQFADAQTLMRDNTHLIGRDLRLARPGDLIFYRQLDQDSPYDVSDYHSPFHSPFHSMIFTGEAVVYHTGPIHHGKGEMRRLLITDLLHHPDARWRPVAANDNFLGVFRWNILREGD